MKIYRWIITIAFVAAQAFLYPRILTSGGDVLVNSCFCAISLCFLYAFAGLGKPLLVAGLAGTVVADYYLVVCGAQYKLEGMFAFLLVQALYATYFHTKGFSKKWLWARLILTALAVGTAFGVLGNKTDTLAIVSVCYYANILMNLLMAFCRLKKFFLLAIGFLFFILCDTVVGLQVASQGYLSIGQDTLLHQILFSDINLVWLFYLPSQVLIALAACFSKK